MEQLVEVAIPARAEFIGLVRLVVATLASERRELDDDHVDDLKLAVSEACTSAVEAPRRRRPASVLSFVASTTTTASRYVPMTGEPALTWGRSRFIRP